MRIWESNLPFLLTNKEFELFFKKEVKIEVARLKNKGVLDIKLITIEELLDKRRTLLE